MAESISKFHEMVMSVGVDFEDIDVKRIEKAADKAAALIASGLTKGTDVAFGELGKIFNETLAKMGKEQIDFADMIKMPDNTTLEKMTSDFTRALTKNMANGISEGIQQGMADALKSRKFLKTKNQLDEAFERNKNSSGKKTGKYIKSGITNKIKGAFAESDFDAPAKIIGGLRSASNEYEKSANWEEQYAALLKYIKAYDALEKASPNSKALKSHNKIGDYTIEELRQARPDIEHSLQNIFNVAYGKATEGLTQNGDIDIGVKLTPIKTIDTYDVTDGKGYVEVEVKPVVKKAKDAKANMFRGVHKPKQDDGIAVEGSRVSRDIFGGSYWGSDKYKDLIDDEYGKNSGEDGAATIGAVAKALNKLTVDAFKDRTALRFDQMDQIDLLKYLFPGVEKFKNIADVGGYDSIQKFYNEAARQAGFDLLEILNVDEQMASGDSMPIDEFIPLQERIIEYVGNLPEYLNVEKFTPDMERKIISQQAGSFDRWAEETLNRLYNMFKEAVAIDKDPNYFTKKENVDKGYFKTNEQITEAQKLLPDIIKQVKQMRSVAKTNFDAAIEKYGGYSKEDFERGLPQTISKNEDGELIARVSQDALKDVFDRYFELNNATPANDKERKRYQNELNDIRDVLLSSVPKNLREDAEFALDDFAEEAKTLEEAIKYFTPHLLYEENSQASEKSSNPTQSVKDVDITKKEETATINDGIKARQEEAESIRDSAQIRTEENKIINAPIKTEEGKEQVRPLNESSRDVISKEDTFDESKQTPEVVPPGTANQLEEINKLFDSIITKQNELNEARQKKPDIRKYNDNETEYYQNLINYYEQEKQLILELIALKQQYQILPSDTRATVVIDENTNEVEQNINWAKNKLQESQPETFNDTLTQENESLRTELEKVKKDLTASESFIETLKQERHDAENQTQALSDTYAQDRQQQEQISQALRDELSLKEKTIEALRKENSVLRDENLIQQGQLENSNSYEGEAQTKIDALTDRLAELETLKETATVDSGELTKVLQGITYSVSMSKDGLQGPWALEDTLKNQTNVKLDEIRQVIESIKIPSVIKESATAQDKAKAQIDVINAKIIAAQEIERIKAEAKAKEDQKKAADEAQKIAQKQADTQKKATEKAAVDARKKAETQKKQDVSDLERGYVKFGKLQAEYQFASDGTEYQTLLKNEISKLQTELAIKREALGVDEKSLINLAERIRLEEVNKKNVASAKKQVNESNNEDKKKQNTRKKLANTQIDRAGKMQDAFPEDNLTSYYRELLIKRDEVTDRLQDLMDGTKYPTLIGDKREKKIVDTTVELKKYNDELERAKEIHKRIQEQDPNALFIGGTNLTTGDSANKYQKTIEETVKNFEGKDVEIGKFDEKTRTLNYTVKTGAHEFQNYTAKVDIATGEIVRLNGALTHTKSWFEQVKGKTKELVTYFAGLGILRQIGGQIKQGVRYVKEIDDALVELKKVTNETDEAYKEFLNTTSKTSSKIGSTIRDLTLMTAEWAKLGYTIKESAKLAESTAILLNVSEFNNPTDASQALISIMQAFGYTADQSMYVLDVLNEIGNNYAVSSAGIASALQDSASALMTAGNSYEESVAMVASANKVVKLCHEL